MFLTTQIRILFVIFITCSGVVGSPYKETSQIIKEWVQTEQLISEESSEWEVEKASLHDIRNTLLTEIRELNDRLEESKEEAVGAAKQRSELLEEKEQIEETTLSLLKGVEQLNQQVQEMFEIIPTPLAQRLKPFQDKLVLKKGQPQIPFKQRVDTLLSLIQAISLYHRTVTLERQEFSLEDGISREFQVLYFGLSVAYFVNESGTVAGYGMPGGTGWKWKRQDSLALEISTGVDILQNQAMPRFLKLPFPKPNSINR